MSRIVCDEISQNFERRHRQFGFRYNYKIDYVPLVLAGLRKRRKAFLDMLLEAEEHGYQLTDEELREEVDTFMFEVNVRSKHCKVVMASLAVSDVKFFQFQGHDTTTAAMCWALQLLGSHPDVQNKVHEEQDGIFQGSARSATMKDLTDMKYLELVIKETLRLYPSVPMVGRTLTEEVQIGNYIHSRTIYQIRRD